MRPGIGISKTPGSTSRLARHGLKPATVDELGKRVVLRVTAGLDLGFLREDRDLAQQRVAAAVIELQVVVRGEVVRQRRRRTNRSLVTSSFDCDPASVRLRALTGWPAGIAGLAAAAGLPRLDIGPRWGRPCRAADSG